MMRTPNVALAHEVRRRGIVQRSTIVALQIDGLPENPPPGIEFCTVREPDGTEYRVVSTATGYEAVPA